MSAMIQIHNQNIWWLEVANGSKQKVWTKAFMLGMILRRTVSTAANSMWGKIFLPICSNDCWWSNPLCKTSYISLEISFSPPSSAIDSSLIARLTRSASPRSYDSGPLSASLIARQGVLHPQPFRGSHGGQITRPSQRKAESAKFISQRAQVVDRLREFWSMIVGWFYHISFNDCWVSQFFFPHMRHICVYVNIVLMPWEQSEGIMMIRRAS